ncbi:MAG: hypothetical protein IKM26_08000 [Clostridia bacterium]|nr:hypothetical protein [Clostridia bacterium]MBR6787851.1 hypothetical protein [Clostridia bacterium]
MRDMLLILNFDESSSRAIARALRAEHIYCEIVPGNISSEEIEKRDPLGLILSGGVKGGMPSGLQAEVAQNARPMLALGDAAAMLCRALGGDALETAICNSIGAVRFRECELTQGIDDCERMLHNVRRLRMPEGAVALAESLQEPVGFMLMQRPVYGIQFTLEQNDTDGMQLLLNFAEKVCNCTKWWTYEAFVERTVEDIQRMAGEGHAVCAMTGGLDSGVSAVLAHKALGNRLKGIFIDTGLLRDGEAAQVLSFYRDQLGMEMIHVQAQERFLAALDGVVDANQKRAIIGEMIQKILDEAMTQVGAVTVVVRGTNCNDVLGWDKQKRRPALQADVPMIEPLRELFKSEIRQVGSTMYMPPEVLSRQSFPGSGLALRILGAVTPARLQTLRAVDRIFTEELTASGQMKRLWQHFAVLSPMAGDDPRAMIALRAVNSAESSQGYAARLPYDLLERVMDRIRRERPEVSRVVYDLTSFSRYDGVEWQ